MVSPRRTFGGGASSSLSWTSGFEDLEGGGDLVLFALRPISQGLAALLLGTGVDSAGDVDRTTRLSQRTLWPPLRLVLAPSLLAERHWSALPRKVMPLCCRPAWGGLHDGTSAQETLCPARDAKFPCSFFSKSIQQEVDRFASNFY